MQSGHALPRTVQQRVTAVLRGAPAAIVLLTRIPIPRYRGQPEDWRRAAAWFPVVGAGLGLILCGVWQLTDALGAFTAGVFVIITSILVTGALHEDGLADSLDALGGSSSRERLFEILKDSRNGTYGTLALIATVLLRVSLLTTIDDVAAALVLSHTIARTAPVWLMAELPYVTPSTHARNTAVANAGRTEAVMATIAALVVSMVLVVGVPTIAAPTALAWIAVAIATVMCARFYRARAGGITGDFLGMNEQVGECLVLLVFAVGN